MLTPREKSPLPKKSPEEDPTRDAVDSEPKHYQLSYSGPPPPPPPLPPPRCFCKAKRRKKINEIKKKKSLFLSYTDVDMLLILSDMQLVLNEAVPQ